jgi:hypothetical protein
LFSVEQLDYHSIQYLEQLYIGVWAWQLEGVDWCCMGGTVGGYCLVLHWER